MTLAPVPARSSVTATAERISVSVFTGFSLFLLHHTQDEHGDSGDSGSGADECVVGQVERPHCPTDHAHSERDD